MAFKSMLKFEYTLLEETNVRELFEAIYVADKYLLHQVIVMIEDKVEKFMIQEDNVGKAASYQTSGILSGCVGHKEACKVRDNSALKRIGIVKKGSYRSLMS